jgi:hypothetical protein
MKASVRGSRLDAGAPSAPYYASLKEQHRIARSRSATASFPAADSERFTVCQSPSGPSQEPPLLWGRRGVPTVSRRRRIQGVRPTLLWRTTAVVAEASGLYEPLAGLHHSVQLLTRRSTPLSFDRRVSWLREGGMAQTYGARFLQEYRRLGGSTKEWLPSVVAFCSCG